MNPISTAISRRTLLNPNAREFVPISLRSSSSVNITAPGDETEPSTASDNGKTFSDKTVSSDTCASDEESRRYWNAQLPDDIFTPDTDFLTPAVDDNVEPGSLVSASESSAMKDSIDFVADNLSWERTAMNGLLKPGSVPLPAHEFATAHNIPGQLWNEEHGLSSVPLGSRAGNLNCHLSGIGNGLTHSPAFGQASLKESSILDVLNILCNEFPNIPEQSLAEAYQANGGDLGLTIRVLHQIKLQGEASSWHNVLSPSQVSSNSRPLGYSALSTPEFASGAPLSLEDFDGQHPELTRLIRRNKSHWPFDRHGPGELSLGPSDLSSMNSHSTLLDGELNDDRSDGSLLRHKRWLSPRNWMETDDALENILSGLREEARNHGRIRNAYYEQARQAFYVGNRVLAKEASAKEQFHNRLMKAAQTRAAEIESQRSMHNSQSPSFGPGQTQLLDLRGLHVNEAIHILKRELASLRLAARSSRQRQQVFISVGTGHQKGARTPARLLFSVKRYLTEEELLNFTEVQPGILKVIVS